jgi:hypothetical protein
LNPIPHEAQLEDSKSKKKAQKDHLKEGKPQQPITGKKRGKAKQNDKEEVGKAQKSKKSSKST